MYQKVLVPLDGSKRAEAILPYVEGLAKRFNSKVVFLFVEEPPMMLEFDEVIDREAFQKAISNQKKHFYDYFDILSQQTREKDIDVEVCYRRGPVVNAIIETAQSEQANLVAIASHGHSGLSRAFYGSVAAALLQQIDRPLLLIRSL